MDLSKAFTISTDYKDRRVSPDWEAHSFSEIVFIDKEHPVATPLLYQLKDPTASLENLFWNASAPSDIFFLVGEVTSIDRKSKKVLLANRNSISYRYLVMASGSKPMFSIREIEFAAGLQALFDAVKVKPKIPSSFAVYFNPENPAAVENARSPTEPSHMVSVAHPTIASANKNTRLDLHSINKRLYEVQL